MVGDKGLVVYLAREDSPDELHFGRWTDKFSKCWPFFKTQTTLFRFDSALVSKGGSSSLGTTHESGE
jgi:hypothetical protein